MKSILALDLGTKTGWAFRNRAGKVTAGTWVLQTKAETTAAAKLRMDRRLDARIPALFSKLVAMWRDHENPIDFMVFEDVQFSQYTQQTQLWSSFRAVMWLFAAQHVITIDCCPVKTLKKFGTGNGAADKAVMMREAAKLFPGVPIVDDNCADALHLLSWANSITNRTK